MEQSPKKSRASETAERTSDGSAMPRAGEAPIMKPYDGAKVATRVRVNKAYKMFVGGAFVHPGVLRAGETERRIQFRRFRHCVVHHRLVRDGVPAEGRRGCECQQNREERFHLSEARIR